MVHAPRLPAGIYPFKRGEELVPNGASDFGTWSRQQVIDLNGRDGQIGTARLAADADLSANRG